MAPSVKRLGLFGGTFDPPHIGHIIVAEWLSQALGTDKTLFIPAYKHPFDSKSDITPESHRLEMLKRAISGFPRFELYDYEITQKNTSYTIDTVDHVSKEFPGSKLYLFVGEDNLESFDKWKDPADLLDLCTLAVFTRGGKKQSSWSRHKQVIKLESPRIDVSSTMIRERVEKGLAFRSLVPFEVYKYIVEHNLYGYIGDR